VEDDKRRIGDAADDRGLQERAHQVHHHHLPQAWSSVEKGGRSYYFNVSVHRNNVEPLPLSLATVSFLMTGSESENYRR
jgi:hypothetical protein